MVLVVLIFRHPPGNHTSVASFYSFQVITEFLYSQFSLIISSQESYGFTKGQFMLTSDNPIMSK